MFKKLYDVLMMIVTQFSQTSYARLVLAASVIIPLVLSMYTYLDRAIFDTKSALYNIANYSYDGFPWGSYFLAYLGVAKVDVCLTTLFGYICTAVIWSITTDLQPSFVAGKKR
ncbi:MULTISPECIES: hypothetical protein [Acinetobacter calcoaceticus/baumannii complex]|uniref:hypothetical protein n=1 Tax=Acinetobacter calcoaceticus/baumannii complex TaxID=909768 RepID=UPI000DE75B4A|nr:MULTISPECIES: hypothetical protein [Acinetobacter calcoaceticus/baumannii complex]MBN6512110.1 hypothetical protein [Acinetobacter pittii]SSP64940.1 Uncharacterised protein [Acinetobacter baumannii]